VISEARDIAPNAAAPSIAILHGRSVYRQAHALVGVYSLTDAASLGKLKTFVDHARYTTPDAAFVVLGNRAGEAARRHARLTANPARTH